MADAAYNRGRRLEQEEDKSEALAAFNKAIEYDSRMVKAYLGKAYILDKGGDIDGATRCIEIALTVDPHNYEALYSNGVMSFRKNDFQKAFEFYTLSISSNPRNPSAFNNRGNIYVIREMFDEAIADFDKAIDIENTYIYNFNKGVALSHQGLPDEAIQSFSQSISLNKKFYLGYYNRGVMWHDKLDVDHLAIDHAIDDYSQTINLNPEYVDAFLNRGLLFAYLRKYDRAFEDYTLGISISKDQKHPEQWKLYYSRGLIRKRSEVNEALQDFSNAIIYNSSHYKSYLQKSYLFLGINDVDKAIESLTLAIDLADGKNVDCYTQRAVCFARKGRVDLALSDIEAAICFCATAEERKKIFDKFYFLKYTLNELLNNSLGSLIERVAGGSDGNYIEWPASYYERFRQYNKNAYTDDGLLETLLTSPVALKAEKSNVPNIHKRFRALASKLPSENQIVFLDAMSKVFSIAKTENTSVLKNLVERLAISDERQTQIAPKTGSTTLFGAAPVLKKTEIAAFRLHAKNNQWDSESGISPSEFIKTTFKRWLKGGLPLSVIRDAQDNLAGAYSTEISRDPTRRVKGVYVRPNKLPAGAPLAPNASRRMADMTEEKRTRKRAQNLASQARFRTKRSDPKP